MCLERLRTLGFCETQHTPMLSVTCCRVSTVTRYTSCPDIGKKRLPRTTRWRRMLRIHDCLSRPGTPAALHRASLTTDTTARRPAATHADNRCGRPWAC